MLVLVFYVPESHLESVKNSLFAAGAGRLGSYSSCSWQTKGEGQFKPEEGSSPFIGMEGNVTRVKEYRVEMVCGEDCAQKVKEALLSAHPYEVPAWHFLKAIDTI
ncbi:MAG: NGG1p interacting factor NIF3 [Spirochaetia bacterium]|jgi:hypothetical protein|nr:NGG1p interacting factor NIF3 [Spirochaetia bacterium]